MEKEKIVFSGIKPTGNLTIGHYCGALKNWLSLQENYKCYYCVVDMHSITINIEPALLRSNTLDLLALYIALGINPEKCTLFIQSHVPAHAELTWVLNCHTQFGEARRMTQFKEKSAHAPENVNVGLFDYPVLMAADILLYKTDLVPIGDDQKQHLELARTIAERFNGKYSPTFTVPEGIIPKQGARIYSLTDPSIKMGKTDDNPNGVVFLTESPDDIMRKFKRAVTDSQTDIRYDKTLKAGISNLLTIYSVFADKTIKESERIFEGCNYAAFKEGVAQAVIDKLLPIQKRYNEIRADKTYLESVLKVGADKASYEARKTLSKVYRKIGFIV